MTTTELTIKSERIDDFVLLLEIMKRLGFPAILDRHLTRHGLQQGLSWGWVATICLEHPDWLPIYDIVPDKAEVSKRVIFDLAAEEGVWVIGQHFPPFPSLGHVVKQGGGWEWRPRVV